MPTPNLADNEMTAIRREKDVGRDVELLTRGSLCTESPDVIKQKPRKY